MRSLKSTNRQGATAVQFALTIPVLLMFIFGSLEFSRANLIRNMCENAAMEGARAGMLPGAEAQDCVDAAENLIELMGIRNATVTVVPSSITPTTESVSVTVSIPLDDNCMPMSKYVLGKTLLQTVSLPREFE